MYFINRAVVYSQKRYWRCDFGSYDLVHGGVCLSIVCGQSLALAHQNVPFEMSTSIAERNSRRFKPYLDSTLHLSYFLLKVAL